MSISERKAREKAEMRHRILAAAHRMFGTEGFENTSIRKIADRISYSPGAIYRYFASKDDILFALHAEAFNAFRDRLRTTFEIEDPAQRLRAMGREYLAFALENPEYYDLMFILKSPMQSDQQSDSWESGMKAYNCLAETVAEGISQGRFKAQDPQVLTFTIWATVHGMAALAIRERLKMYPQDQIDALMHTAIDDLVDRLIT